MTYLFSCLVILLRCNCNGSSICLFIKLTCMMYLTCVPYTEWKIIPTTCRDTTRKQRGIDRMQRWRKSRNQKSQWYPLHGSLKVVLWWKSHLSNLTHFQTNKKTAWEKRCCLLFSNLSFHSRDIQVFKICKLAKWWRHTLNHILFKYDEKRYLSQFVSKMFDFFAVRFY